MNGAELRAWRTSRGLYQRDVVRILTGAGMAAIDQPTVSEYERGLLEVPAEANAALAAAAADYPVTGEPTPAPAPRKKGKSRRERAVQEDAGGELEHDDGRDEQEPARDDDAGDEQAADDEPDRKPRPVTPAGRVEQHRGIAWDRDVRNQLEHDLRVLFAGDTFLVPVPVQTASGEVVEHMEEAAVPGVAQLVGALIDPYDGRVIEMNAPQMARAWAELADESPAVRRWLIVLTYGGAWRGVMAATLPVLYAIAVHHGIIPPMLGAAGAAPQRVEPATADAAGVA